MNPQLTLLHVHTKFIGYARYGTYLFEELGKRGVDVYDHLEAPDDTPDYTRKILEMGHRPPPGPTNVVAWVSVPTHGRGWWKNQHTVISSMWEAMELPESFRETIHEFDTVIVPSTQNLELFSQYHDNVVYVPLGVDPAVWHYMEKPDPSPFFNFLNAGSGSRKGTDLAHRAFLKVFKHFYKRDKHGRFIPKSGSGPVPRLLMKNPKGEGFHGPGIEVIAGRISAEDEVALYASAHCYVGPSRGEGFGLQPLQALSQGTPTILTNGHGHASFAHLGIPLDWKAAPSQYFIYGHAGNWWEPDFDQLCDRMAWVYENYDQARADATHAAEVISAEFTWERTAEAFVDALGDELTKPYRGGGEWFVPSPRLYPVVTTKDYYAEMAGKQLAFLVGKTYFESADVKRVLWEAGVLDVSCLPDPENPEVVDLGLAPEDVAAYRATAEFCPTCHQRMNSQPTRSDEIFAELEAAS